MIEYPECGPGAFRFSLNVEISRQMIDGAGHDLEGLIRDVKAGVVHQLNEGLTAVALLAHLDKFKVLA